MNSQLHVYHHSGDCRFRQKPFPLAVGEQTWVRIQTDSTQVLSVCIRFYHAGAAWTQEMTRHADYWETTFTVPEQVGILWYYFILDTTGGRLFYGLPTGKTAGEGVLSWDEPASFQVTVHEKNFTTPDWTKCGVMYQIFPDRFRQGDPENLRKGATYREQMGRKTICHGSWQEEVLYRPLDGETDYDPCDFYGGDLVGIEQALPNLQRAGVTVLYLNPICEAASNHRYDTADYHRVDPILGSNDDFIRLTERARALGIRIVLDGVYSHTGADSVYFNRYGTYAEPGAYQGEASPYASWYQFGESREEYRCWWGFRSLPEVNEKDSSWQKFIITERDSVLTDWLDMGASGFRLDVADELPDEVIALMRRAIKEASDEHFLLGEVWEDATIKESYGKSRSYALGGGLDSVMNYPFRNACVDFLLGRSDAVALKQFFHTQQVNYPTQMLYSLMNLLSSHDIPRIRTVLGLGDDCRPLPREEQARIWLTPEQDDLGRRLQVLAVWLSFAVPGLPAIYYGDEYGMEGLRDPFNRRPFQKKDLSMAEIYREAAQLRLASKALQTGFAQYHALGRDVFAVHRFLLDGRDAFGEPADGTDFVFLWNRGNREETVQLPLLSGGEGISAELFPALRQKKYHLLEDGETGECIALTTEQKSVSIPPQSFRFFRLSDFALDR